MANNTDNLIDRLQSASLTFWSSLIMIDGISISLLSGKFNQIEIAPLYVKLVLIFSMIGILALIFANLHVIMAYEEIHKGKKPPCKYVRVICQYVGGISTIIAFGIMVIFGIRW